MLSFRRAHAPKAYEIRRSLVNPDYIGQYCGSVALNAFKTVWQDLEIPNKPALESVYIKPDHVRMLGQDEVAIALHGHAEEAPRLRRSLRRMTLTANPELLTLFPAMIDSVVAEPGFDNTTFSVRFDYNFRAVDQLYNERDSYDEIVKACTDSSLPSTHELGMPFARIPTNIANLRYGDNVTIEERIIGHVFDALGEAREVRGTEQLEAFMVEPPVLTKIG